MIRRLKCKDLIVLDFLGGLSLASSDVVGVVLGVGVKEKGDIELDGDILRYVEL